MRGCFSLGPQPVCIWVHVSWEPILGCLYYWLDELTCSSNPRASICLKINLFVQDTNNWLEGSEQKSCFILSSAHIDYCPNHLPPTAHYKNDESTFG